MPALLEDQAPQQSQGPVAPPAPPAPGRQSGGDAHPLAALAPLASYIGNTALGLPGSVARGVQDQLQGRNSPTAEVKTHHGVHPAQVRDEDGNMPLQDRAWVEAHRRELGMPPDMPAEQFFHEFVAHDLAYKQATRQVPIDPSDPAKGTREVSNYTPYEQAMLRAWGYDARPQEVIDEQTGLYAARFNPLRDARNPDGAPMNPVVAFRGTHDFGGVRADADTYIGRSQYEPHRAEIAALMDPSQGRVVTTGHSLGGALAQKAAADNIGSVAGVTTFQSPGIDYADVNRFNAGNRDGHIQVAHHYNSADTVHRAGDARLDGTFYENRIAGLGGLRSAPGVALASVMPTHTGYLYYNNGDGNIRDPHSQWAERGISTDVTTRVHSEDTVGSRHFHEGMRQGLGSLVTTGIGAYQAGSSVLSGVAQGARDVGQGTMQAAVRTGQGLQGAAVEGWQGATTMGSGLFQAGGDIAHGHVLTGLGRAGQGLAQGAGQILQGGAQAVSSIGHGIAGTAGALGHGAVDVGRGVLQAGGDLIHAGGAAAYQLGKAGMHLSQVPGEVGHFVGQAATSGGQALAGAAGRAMQSTGQAISQGAGFIGREWHHLTGH
jgi:hypothetical protein